MITLVACYLPVVPTAKKVVQQVSCFARGASSVEDFLAFLQNLASTNLEDTKKSETFVRNKGSYKNQFSKL